MDFMKKMTFSEMEKAMVASNLIGEKLYGIIVFKESSFSRYYTLEERSYLVDNMTSMHFQPGAASGSIVGDCLDETDFGARLDRCMREEGWVPEYCYLIERTCRYCKYLHSLKPDSEAFVCNMGWIISPLCLDKKKCMSRRAATTSRKYLSRAASARQKHSRLITSPRRSAKLAGSHAFTGLLS